MRARSIAPLLAPLAGVALLAVGCATESPEAAIRSARYAVERAEDAGARRYAPGDLARARDELREAEATGAERSGHVEARRLAEKALVDAEVAAARSSAEQLRISAEQLRRSVDESGGSGRP